MDEVTELASTQQDCQRKFVTPISKDFSKLSGVISSLLL